MFITLCAAIYEELNSVEIMNSKIPLLSYRRICELKKIYIWVFFKSMNKLLDQMLSNWAIVNTRSYYLPKKNLLQKLTTS